MNASETPVSRGSEWRVPALLVLLGLVPAVSGTGRLAELASGGAVSPSNARFIEAPLPVVLHILTAIPFSLLGAFLFAPALRRRRPSWHRAAGRLLAPCGLIAALTGLWMAHFYPWPEGDGQTLYVLRLGFGSAMTVSILLALRAVWRRDFVSHGAWMTRAYAIGMGAGTQVLTHLPWFILVGRPDEGPRAVMMGAGWVINLVLAEWVIRRRPSPADERSPRPGSPDMARRELASP